LNQNLFQVANYEWIQTNDQEVRIKYVLKEPKFLVQISQNSSFDFYEICPDLLWGSSPISANEEYKLTVYHAELY